MPPEAAAPHVAPNAAAPAGSRLDLVRAIDGRSPRWPTRVAVTLGDSALHVRFECVDRLAWATLTERDAPLYEEEVIEVFLAPGSGDPRVYFELEVNPEGALFVARVESPRGERSSMVVDKGWDWPGLRWRAGRLEERQDWWAELTLPWRGLGLEDDPGLWRANFYRVERPWGEPGPADEYSAWSPTLADPADFHRPGRFGLLVTGAEPIPEAFHGGGRPVLLVPGARRAARRRHAQSRVVTEI